MSETKWGFLAHMHSPMVSIHALRIRTTFGLGVILLADLAILVVTGMLLAFAYEPDFYNSYESVWEISHVYPYGHWLRSLHYLAGNAALILSLLHFIRVINSGAYVRNRFRNYCYGLLLFICMFLALASGYFLPMNEVAYWALTVGLSFLDYFPVVGDVLKGLLRGGPAIATATVIRLHALHVVILPLFLVVLASLHLWRIRKDKGLAKPPGLPAGELEKVPRSYALTREWTAVLATVLLLMTLAWVFPVAIHPRPDPSMPPNPVKAVWFFIALQETLSYSATWGGTVPLTAATGFFILFPLLAERVNPASLPRINKVFVLISLTLIILYICFTIVGLYRGPNWTFNDPLKIFRRFLFG